MSFYRLTIHGHLPNGEIWNSTVHMSHTNNAAAALVTPCSSGITSMWSGPPTPANSIQQLVPASVGIDGFTIDELSATGRNIAQVVTALSLVGTNATTMWPHSSTVAVSTRSALPTRGGRGRGFLPPFGVDQLTAGLISSTAQGQIARAYASMLTTINGVATGKCVIYSRAHNTGQIITSVDVGNVPDVQRRRRNAFPEIRVSQTV